MATERRVRPPLGWPLVASTAEIERAVEAFASAPNGGLVVPPDATGVTHRDLIVALATRYRLPAVY